MTTNRDAIRLKLEHAEDAVKKARAALAENNMTGVGAGAGFARLRLGEIIIDYGRVTANTLDEEARPDA